MTVARADIRGECSADGKPCAILRDHCQFAICPFDSGDMLIGHPMRAVALKARRLPQFLQRVGEAQEYELAAARRDDFGVVIGHAHALKRAAILVLQTVKERSRFGSHLVIRACWIARSLTFGIPQTAAHSQIGQQAEQHAERRGCQNAMNYFDAVNRVAGKAVIDDFDGQTDRKCRNERADHHPCQQGPDQIRQQVFGQKRTDNRDAPCDRMDCTPVGEAGEWRETFTGAERAGDSEDENDDRKGRPQPLRAEKLLQFTKRGLQMKAAYEFSSVTHAVPFVVRLPMPDRCAKRKRRSQ